MQRYMQDHAIPTIWPTQERMLVAISPSPLAARLVRGARRMAARLHAEWLVVYVETPAHVRLPDAARSRHPNLALSRKTGRPDGHAQRLRYQLKRSYRYARQRNVNKIVIGKPDHPRWRELIFGSVMDKLVRASGEIDVYAISGEREDVSLPTRPTFVRTSPWSAYAKALVVVALCTGIAQLIFQTLDCPT